MNFHRRLLHIHVEYERRIGYRCSTVKAIQDTEKI